MNVVIEQISLHHPKARALLKAAAACSTARYPPSSQHHLDLESDVETTTLVAWAGGDTVACVVLRSLEPGIGEVKSLFVEPAHRRLGLARTIMGALEALAETLRYRTIRLETGTLQPEAIALYQHLGYEPIQPYGEYVGDPMSVCFEKRLDG